MYEIEKYESIKKWMGRLAPSTQKVNLSYFNSFSKWYRGKGEKFAEMSPDQLIECSLDASTRELNELLDMVIDYINSTNGRAETKKSRYTVIRSFFKHNRTPLPSDPFIIRGDVPPVQGTLTAEEIKNMVLACQPRYAAAFLCMFQSGMDQEMITYWSQNGYTQLLEDLEAYKHGVPYDAVIKIDLPGRKRNRNIKPFYTFIGKDAIEALQNYLKRRPDRMPTFHPDDMHKRRDRRRVTGYKEAPPHIFLDRLGHSFSKSGLRHYWIRQLRRLGLVKHTKGQRMDKTGKGLHEMRDVFRSLWEKSPASGTVAEYCMGHSIDPLEYDKSFRDVEYYKTQYLKAAPMLNLISGGEAFGYVENTELEREKRRVRDLEKQVAQLQHEKNQGLDALQQQINELREKILKDLEKPEA